MIHQLMNVQMIDKGITEFYRFRSGGHCYYFYDFDNRNDICHRI